MTSYITAEDLYLSIRTDGNEYDNLITACRVTPRAKKVAAFMAIVRRGWKTYKKTVNSNAVIHTSTFGNACDMLIADVQAHFNESYSEETPQIEAYFIVDDAVGHNGALGFELLYGNPYTAVGTVQGQSMTVKALVALVPAGEPVYRVFLARRHNEHKVKIIQNKA